MLSTEELYQILFKYMGPQHWWPAENAIEMMLGVILVQNTNWKNAHMALMNLKAQTNYDVQKILNMPLDELQQTIRSSGFYKNKGKAIHTLMSWLNNHHFDCEAIVQHYGKNLRKELLKIRGIGSETADVLLVYIFRGIEFIPDSYARRIFAKLGYQHTETYDQFKREIELPESFSNQDANEFHALLDTFGKNYFNGKDEHRHTFLDAYFEN
ncbi:endonuclease III domain-containing protein [Staphylococcus saccharolyticus]|uniref:Endonuclease III n=1 Tax=Staphylococcus saccharolyticus TaxID=33028 RepID=A0A380H9Q9_9STAP|nr:endonuclease III domain-containing protein [Staphylococcus saccharolyticus]MBL7565839.1 endonuclease III domain-containing protein [Staphylococcus saccharolyticus]MBL7572079.1 endonuclease III domain-containing protein [Staphylococcus saccharolyticus]QQB97645.1 endonuclease III domain-containing protein [Staphylococcus saccharolyticus]QRJ66503.1 endonuclease III domain-containing protein [Staphylococcus saccharolyticus]RTX96181.1 endonuclease III domain-containing protein [Staphylococcus sa